MKRAYGIFFLFLLSILSFGLLQQSTETSLNCKEYLGFSLMPGANSTAVSFHVVKKWDDPAKPIEAYNISQQEFMRIALGLQQSNANPGGKNLFAENGISQCGLFNDTVINHMIVKGGMKCNPVDDIWRLRWGQWPFYIAVPRNVNPNTVQNLGPGPGWAQKPLQPSEGQLEILRGYGVTDPMVDLFWGNNAWKLLKDMQNPDWVSSYRGS